MSPAISPVLSRIQTIETRFAVPTEMRIGASAAGGDFASQLAAAFADSSLGVGVTDAGDAVAAGAPPVPGAVPGTDAFGAFGAGAMANAGVPGTLRPGSYAVPTSSPAALALLTGSSGTATHHAAINGAISGASPTAGVAGVLPGAAGAAPFADLFATAGARHGVPPVLLSAVGWVESRYQVDAVSSAGAEGVMQLMPFVSEELGVDPWDPSQAIDGAARLLRSHFDRFGSWDLALAAYNAGAGAVSRAGNAIPSPRVGEYVRRVNERMTA
jgi:soluble lytic murein transglycosylase-like protein